MKLVNIFNQKRKVYLFCRDSEGNQVIVPDETFYPYFYEPHLEGQFTGYDGVKLKKIIVSEPADVPKYRSTASYSSDIVFTKNYLIHRIPKLMRCPIKYIFLDIEVTAKELPTYENPIHTISCISTYNSTSQETKTWFIKDFLNEEGLLHSFVKYLSHEKPDLLLAWNMENFDYPYLYFRYKKLFKRDFSRDISPINDIRRYHKIDNLNYPAGISVLDYLQLFKKVFMREASYALDYVAQKHLGEQSLGQYNFGVVSEEVRQKNVIDINRMVKIEQKYQILPYFNEIRLMSKVLWEDLYFNSYIVEMLLFEEAKLKNIILPNCPAKDDSYESTFEGAIRECLSTGALFEIGKFDLTSAYPNMIRNFCLDPQNIGADEADAEMYGAIKINNVQFTQRKDALLPSLIDKLLVLKDTLKAELKKTGEGTEENRKATIKYNAIKAVVNSAFGVMGLQSFRIFDNTVASTITFLVRELLMYVKDQVEQKGYKVVYYDTDSLFLQTKENVSLLLNSLIQQWAKEKYGKDHISIEFDYEGYFDKIFLLTKCRYYGYLHGSKGVKIEIKGMEIKRASSSKYEGEFQKTLIDKILNKETQENIVQWIKEEKNRIKTLPLQHVSFPCKLGTRVYKNIPIFIRAYENTKKLNPNFDVEKGSLFYYTYLKTPYGDQNVLAFTEKDMTVIQKDRIDYEELIRRNIDMKTMAIFEAMDWKTSGILTSQLSLF